VREHNFQAARIAAVDLNLDPNNPMDDEEIFQRARRMVMAEIQKITYEDWLPALMGENPLPNYQDYDPNVNVQIANSFQHAIFRLGHSLINPWILRIGDDGEPAGVGPISLAEGFFRPETIFVQDSNGNGGLEAIFRGMSAQAARELDPRITVALRDMLFGPPLNDMAMDLAAINIARGRDHGIPDYNTVRQFFGLPAIERFSDISSDDEILLDLFTTFRGNLDLIEPWVGALSEDHTRGSVGPTIAAALIDQFTRLRDGDAFHYARPEQIPLTDFLELEETTLADIILRNTNIECLPHNVFFVDPDFDYSCN